MSTNTPDPDDLAALASDPRTDWEMLHWIAEHHAQLRPAVAANPGAYAELVEALGQLGDPAIDAAIAQRPDVASGPFVASPAETDPLHQMWDPRTDDIPVHQEETANLPAQPVAEPVEEPLAEPHEPEILGVPAAAASPSAASASAPTPEPASEPEPDSYNYSVNPAPADHPTPPPLGESAEAQSFEPLGSRPAPAPAPRYSAAPAAAAPVAYPAAQSAGAETGAYPAARYEAAPEQQSRPKRKGSGAKILAGVALALVAILGIGALLFTTLGDEHEPVAEPAPIASEESTSEEEPSGEASAEEEPSEEPTAEEGPSEEALAEARTSVSTLAADSTCESESEDASRVTDFLALGAEGDALTGEDATMMEETFADLQSECSSVYAATVFQGARNGADSSAATETMDSVGTDWVNRSISISGAATMSSFVTPDGNIACEFGDGLRCTAYEHEYVAPEGCDEGTTYLMQVDAAAALDCGNPVDDEGNETLGIDQAATDGFMACVSLDDRVSCYNALTGNGFEISERGHYPTT
ncbi:hypothetical protein [Nesterenkonia sp. Act20]|uniref:variant leucine-rich repeat-containing protein n=1 Tax=Nesterenkonia sp. Act20 TaxID=1483432 RepID=UPI001C4659B1|nr:hypothetical protein [Nesterenkonia sp. Act20]